MTHLHASGQHLVQDVRASLHECDVSMGGVLVLAVADRIDETIHEFLARS